MKDKTNKVLFLVPSPKSKGGISNYYSVIKGSIKFPYEYFYRGVRKQYSWANRFFSLFINIFDYIVFFFKLKSGEFSLVILNTSFGRTGFWRDYLFIRIIRFFKMKYIVFFRGIDYTVFDNIYRRQCAPFKSTFLQADGIIVLSSELKQRLIALGYKKGINIETTVVDSDMLNGVSIDKIIEKMSSVDFPILFLSRIEKSKGIYELLESFRMIHKKYPHVSLRFCGDGTKLNTLKKQIHKTESVFFTGYIDNKNKIREYSNAQVFILPSYHEGLPNSIVEAMSFGLPVITTSVGGIPDIFIDGVNGILLKELNQTTIFNALEHYITNIGDRKDTALYNFNYAKGKFYKEDVVVRLSHIINEVE